MPHALLNISTPMLKELCHIPEGVDIVGIEYSFTTEILILKIAHKDFPENYENCELPAVHFIVDPHDGSTIICGNTIIHENPGMKII